MAHAANDQYSRNLIGYGDNDRREADNGRARLIHLAPTFPRDADIADRSLASLRRTSMLDRRRSHPTKPDESSSWRDLTARAIIGAALVIWGRCPDARAPLDRPQTSRSGSLHAPALFSTKRRMSPAPTASILPFSSHCRTWDMVGEASM